MSGGSRLDPVAGLLRRTPPQRALDWALRSVGPGSDLISVETLTGGISHANHALKVGWRGTMTQVVLRRWVRPDWQQTDADYSPAREAAAYRLLAASEVPAPRLLAMDGTGAECDVPALLLTRVPGKPLRRPLQLGSFVSQMASALTIVHGVDPELAARTVPPFGRFYEPARLSVPDWTARPAVWARAIEAAIPEPPAAPRRFIHRDYHPGNILWTEDRSEPRFRAIVDWTSTSFGAPSFDVAHMRTNLAMLFGLESVDAFLEACLVSMGPGFDYDPVWDVIAAVDMLPELPSIGSPAAIEQLEALVARSLSEGG